VLKPIPSLLILPVLALFAPATSPAQMAGEPSPPAHQAVQTPPVASLQAEPPAAAQLTDLTDDLSLLKRDFNASAGEVRMLLVLSPGCPGCQEGSQVIQQKLLEKLSSPSLKLYVVWFPLLPKDNRELAQKAVSYFHDPRVRQYWLPSWKLANGYGGILEFPKDYKYQVAVDVYMVFDDQVKWEDALPRPTTYMHRLGEAPNERHLDGDKLRDTVEKLVQQAVARNACQCTAKNSGERTQ
jgi:hypothetical protein